ncbi:MAG: radical SAM protein, partial [Candidatus Bathyarchaeia archaeon]
MEYKFIFGPVPSRRLGRSLGIDLVPFKTCPYDCIYCQLGRTTKKTVERMEYISTPLIMEEIDRRLKEPSGIDFITFSGSGEPTLHSGLGELISRVKKWTDIPVAVLTNGGLFFNPQVRKAVLDADLVIPSLDCGDEEMFQRINRPHPDISFQQMVEGLVYLREEFRGVIWLEVFLVKGINTLDNEVHKIASWSRKIRPDRIQLNTVERPPAEPFVKKPSDSELMSISRVFDGNVDIISSFSDGKRGIHVKGRSFLFSNEIISFIM